jgi:hypothetical protein
MSNYKYDDKNKGVLEFHDFMCDENDEIRIPPAIMKDYVPIKQPLSANIKSEIKAIMTGLTVATAYGIIGFFSVQK